LCNRIAQDSLLPPTKCLLKYNNHEMVTTKPRQRIPTVGIISNHKQVLNKFCKD